MTREPGYCPRCRNEIYRDESGRTITRMLIIFLVTFLITATVLRHYDDLAKVKGFVCNLLFVLLLGYYLMPLKDYGKNRDAADDQGP